MSGIDDIATERRRQVDVEGYDPANDLRYGRGELARAAATYATPRGLRTPTSWPWAASTFKPTPDDRRRELVKAGALILAEIDRLDAEAKR